MSTPTSPARELIGQGLWDSNPALFQLLGLCPLLAVSNSTVNALGLGLATVIVLTLSSAAVSALRPIARSEIRLPLFVLIIATTVTSVELAFRAWLPGLYSAIGLFIPLIVTNCMILGRAEAFAARQRVHLAALDGLAMAVGFLWVLVAIGATRELVGHGTMFADMQLLFGPAGESWRIALLPGQRGLLIALLPTGAFFAFAMLIAVGNALATRRRSARAVAA